jgi:hypothetical protein
MSKLHVLLPLGLDGVRFPTDCHTRLEDRVQSGRDVFRVDFRIDNSVIQFHRELMLYRISNKF